MFPSHDHTGHISQHAAVINLGTALEFKTVTQSSISPLELKRGQNETPTKEQIVQ